ncbi:uncharacterized protein LOC143054783 [Mytilus galloprovincialis]|uniref:uncharacterized protein LOC143054783 n=1 Tax=Mytilus galloprovincialis TaxID=29158 RepID=UPI003F7C525E
MNRNSSNDEKDNDQNVRGLRKITYLVKYGVKHFPYRGRRRYTPSVERSEDGGIFISNDVFGLTIRQFERMYKACLDRRKANEQYIINIRYPDKTSNEYMEYLENSRYCIKDYILWSENGLKERYLYEHLVRIVGTEIDIRKRQQLFIIKDMTNNSAESLYTRMSSGSLAEGIDLPGSDLDLMLIIKDEDVIRDVRHMKHREQGKTFLMETDAEHPGFTRLRLLTEGDMETDFKPYEYFKNTRKDIYLSVNDFLSVEKNIMQEKQLLQHGPCLSDRGQNVDMAVCFRSKYLPYNAIPWASRNRQQWPPNSAIDKIKKYGCLLVPIGPRLVPDCNDLWRMSFSVAEKQLVHSFNFTQLICYCLLKLTLKHIVNKNKHVEGLLCSYFLKTALFWVSEELDIETFQISKLFVCFFHCLDKLISWVKKCYCPNYFIPEHNMFFGKIDLDNNKILINVLDGIKCDGIDGLINNLCPNNTETFPLLVTNSKYSSIRLDFLFYKINALYFMNDISQCLKALMFTESLIKSKHSTLVIDVCKYYNAGINQNIAQLLSPPTTNTETYKIHKRYHRHLQDGIKTDAVSGWLLYASFYYVTGQYYVTLKLTDYVLSRCSADVIITRFANYREVDMNNYGTLVHSTMTLNDKMRLTTVNNVRYAMQSSIIPMELQLEVENHSMDIPPTVMSRCLRFLCYHHLSDIFYKQQALRDLYCTIKDMNFIRQDTLSISITILGVCFEISGDKNTAYQCYEEALKCYFVICPSARVRQSKLLEI